MTTLPIRHTLLLASLALVASAALAQDNGTVDPKVDFKTLDRNNDGYLSRDELPADHFLLSRFVELDGNADGRLSPDELAKME